MKSLLKQGTPVHQPLDVTNRFHQLVSDPCTRVVRKTVKPSSLLLFHNATLRIHAQSFQVVPTHPKDRQASHPAKCTLQIHVHSSKLYQLTLKTDRLVTWQHVDKVTTPRNGLQAPTSSVHDFLVLKLMRHMYIYTHELSPWQSGLRRRDIILYTQKKFSFYQVHG